MEPRAGFELAPVHGPRAQGEEIAAQEDQGSGDQPHGEPHASETFALDDAAHGKQEAPAAQPGTGAEERQTPGPEPLYEPHHEPHHQPHYEPAVAERPGRPE